MGHATHHDHDAAGKEPRCHTVKRPVLADSVLAHIAAARRPTLLEDVALLRERLMEPVAYTFANGRTIMLGAWDLQRWIAESLGYRAPLRGLGPESPARSRIRARSMRHVLGASRR